MITLRAWVAGAAICWGLSPNCGYAAVKVAGLSQASVQATQDGIDLIYAMDFSAADRKFRQVLQENPNHPFGHYGLAAASWVHFVYGSQRSDRNLEGEFQSRAKTAILKSKQWLKNHPRDPHALLALGGSYGLTSRLALTQKRWLAAALEGRKAIQATRQAHKSDPTLYDAYLGIGMWEYYSDVFPRIIRSLGKLLLGGDRHAGLRHIQLAAEKGRFVWIAAELILIEIYLEDPFGFQDLPKALSMIGKLREKFPQSPIFHQIEQVIVFEMRDWDATWHVTQEYVQRIDAKVPFYDEEDRVRMDLVFGMVEFGRGRLDEAKTHLEKASRRAGDRSRPNRWALWASYRLGEVQDAMGRREEAKRSYRSILALPDLFGIHSFVRRRLARPFLQKSQVGSFIPP